jgi:two-component system cell cycle sensor histidine kinase PleC
MLGNLVDNAIRFTPAGGRVSVAAYAASDGVVLEVTDSGIGMTPERLAAVSQPFAFGDASLARDRDGAGLGLAIARAIVQLSGGHLAIDSRQGLGTTVAVSLPALAAAPEVDIAA